MRTRIVSLAAVLAVSAAGLTACAANPAYPSHDGCVSSLPLGDSVQQIDVGADDNDMPTIDVSMPLVTEGAQVDISGGKGRRAASGDVVDSQYAIYSGKTGMLLSTSYENEALQASSPLRITANDDTVLGQALSCTAKGSQLVLTTTIADVFGESASSEAQDVQPTDTAIVVFNVTGVYAGHAEGTLQPGVSGMPSIALGESGRPGITFTGADAPAELKTTLNIKGSGAEVAEGDQVLVQYTGVVWETETVFDSSWENGNATAFVLSDDQVIPGFVDALVGQQVGSQVVTSIPQELAYSDPASRPSTIPEGAHLLFVIDILAIL